MLSASFGQRLRDWLLLSAPLGLALLVGAFALRLTAPTTTYADTPTICDSVPHVMVGGIDLSGRWNSNYGVVVLTQVGSSISGTIAYTNGNAGTYTGCFDGQTLYFGYDSGTDSGTAAMTYGRNGCTLTGSYQSAYDSTNYGSYTMSRC
jgi:hypothetical protein